MIEKYPRQEKELRKTACIVLEEAFSMPNLRKWAKNLKENAKLAKVPLKLKERINRNFKPYLHVIEMERQQPSGHRRNMPIIELSQDKQGESNEQNDEQDKQNDLETQDYINIDEYNSKTF